MSSDEQERCAPAPVPISPRHLAGKVGKAGDSVHTLEARRGPVRSGVMASRGRFEPRSGGPASATACRCSDTPPRRHSALCDCVGLAKRSARPGEQRGHSKSLMGDTDIPSPASPELRWYSGYSDIRARRTRQNLGHSEIRRFGDAASAQARAASSFSWRVTIEGARSPVPILSRMMV
jgi:hypothetical protein